MCREMASGKLFLIYVWNKRNPDTQLEWKNEEL